MLMVRVSLFGYFYLEVICMAKSRPPLSPGGLPDPFEPDVPKCSGDAAEPDCSWVIPTKDNRPKGYQAAHDPEFHVKFPTLHAWLVLTGRSGKDRKPGSIVVFAEDGKWKAACNDKETRMVAFVSGESLEGLLGAIDKGLKAGTLDWRDSKR